MNHPQTLIAALAGAPEIIIGLVREVPLQRVSDEATLIGLSLHSA